MQPNKTTLRTVKSHIIRALRWSEKYTKTDMVYLTGNGLWVLLGQIAVSGSAFTITLVLANTLNKELFGQYRFITTIIPIIALFALSSLGNAIVRSVARGHTINWYKLIKTKLYFSLIASAISLLIAGYYFVKSNTLLAQIYIIVALFIPFYDLFLLYNHYLQGIGDFKHASKYLGITRLVQAILVIAVAVSTHNILYIIASFFIGLILPQYFFYKRTRNMHKKVPEQGIEHNIITYAIHLTMIQGAILITGNLDKIFTWHYLGAEQFAIYAIGLTLPLNILLLFNFIPQIYFPRVSKLTLDLPTRKSILKKVALMLALLSVVAILYALISPWLLPLLFTAYSTSVSITIALATLIPLLPTNTLFLQIFQAHNMFGHILALRILSAIVFSTVFFTIYKHLPIYAPALAFIISELIVLIFSILFLRYARLTN